MGCSASLYKTQRLKRSEQHAKVMPITSETQRSIIPDNTPEVISTTRLYKIDSTNTGLTTPVKKFARRSMALADYFILERDTATTQNQLTFPSASPVESNNSIKEPSDSKSTPCPSGGFEAIVLRKTNVNDPRCYNGHILRINTDRMRSWSCFYCAFSSEKEASFYCKLCEFDICSFCYTWEKTYSKAMPQYIKCPEDHPLRVTPRTIVEGFYNLIGKTLPVICQSCSEQFIDKQTINHCRICRFNLCNPCKMCIQEDFENKQNVCPKSHTLLWRYNTATVDKSYRCGMCRKEYYLLGSFGCIECNYHICIRCSFCKIQI